MEDLELNIGKITIPYRVVESPKATRKRLILTPYNMEVRVPRGTPTLDVKKFLGSKEKWIVQSWDELRSKVALDVFPSRFSPGSKIMKWGRFVRLDVRKSPDVSEVKVSGGAPILVEIPENSNWEEKEEEIAKAVTIVLIDRLKDAITGLVEQHSNKLSSPKTWSISKSSDKWGYCSGDGNLGFHWQLVCCPKSVLEYVVVHELAHLTHRTHNEDFWSLVRSVLPNYELQKKWLEVDGARIAAHREP
ncbi:MAG: M48 family metallopeptidase [Deltaproteobacteria bacterium]|nr:M48 family metallopeptidase [Deltaproteobacteria bacterium]